MGSAGWVLSEDRLISDIALLKSSAAVTGPIEKETRLDVRLVETGVFRSRARAQQAVKAGLVRVDGAQVLKPSQLVGPDAVIEADGDVHPYVSRGGLKLEAALRHFDIEARDRVCLDLGASTGGFCDVLLRAGARKVYAVDVGVGQLDDAIANDPRVINLEKTHARDLSAALVPQPIELLTCDVSFISLKKALPPALALCAPDARLAALIKPQFEVGRAQIGKGGLVKPGRANAEGAAEALCAWLDQEPGWAAQGYCDSPIIGGDGNREFLMGGVKTLAS